MRNAKASKRMDEKNETQIVENLKKTAPILTFKLNLWTGTFQKKTTFVSGTVSAENGSVGLPSQIIFTIDNPEFFINALKKAGVKFSIKETGDANDQTGNG